MKELNKIVISAVYLYYSTRGPKKQEGATGNGVKGGDSGAHILCLFHYNIFILDVTINKAQLLGAAGVLSSG